MTKITIVIGGEQKREYDFQTLNDEEAEMVTELLIRNADNTIAILDAIGAINAEDPPELEE